MFIRKLTTYWATVWADSASGVPSSGQPMQTARKSKAAEELQKNKKGCTVTQSYKKTSAKTRREGLIHHTHTQSHRHRLTLLGMQIFKRVTKNGRKNWELITCNCTHRRRLTIPGTQICFVSASCWLEGKRGRKTTMSHLKLWKMWEIMEKKEIPSEVKVAPRYTLLTVTLFTLLNTIQTALHCSNSGMHAYIYCYKVRTPLNFGFMGFWAKCWMEWMDWVTGIQSMDIP